MTQDKPLCIYHGNCADGFAAAWVVRKALGGNVDFHPGVYQNKPPEVAGRDVLMVDFSYKREVIEWMRLSARSIRIIDHHKSAMEDLTGKLVEDRASCPVELQFDMNRSGAGMTWDHFFPDLPRPRLINHIEDRDLWKFALPWTREIQAAVFSYPYEFSAWDELMHPDNILRLHTEGEAIERKLQKDVAELVAVCKRRMLIGGHIVWGASLPYTLTSDAGHLMASEGEMFAACYWDTPDGRVFSLRSREDGADVSEIAKAYGGGGHKHASGFRVPLSEIGKFEI